MLSKRLLKIASLVPTCDVVADIGTDHGYLPYHLIEKGICQRAILCDVNPMPLENAKKNIKASSPVTFLLGSGIQPIDVDAVDCVVIAGMGGGLIKSILSDDMKKSKGIKWLVLQPQTEQSELRLWLLNNGFVIHSDAYVKDMGKYYEVLCVTHSALMAEAHFDTYLVSTDDLEFGHRVLKSDAEAYIDFLNHKLNKYTLILDQLPNTEAFESKRSWCDEKIRTIHVLLKEAEYVNQCGSNIKNH